VDGRQLCEDVCQRFNLRLMTRWSSCALVVLGTAVVAAVSLPARSAAQTAPAPAQASASPVDTGLAALYARLEQALVAGEPSQILAATPQSLRDDFAGDEDPFQPKRSIRESVAEAKLD